LEPPADVVIASWFGAGRPEPLREDGSPSVAKTRPNGDQ
jgi:hypothetical protein